MILLICHACTLTIEVFEIIAQRSRNVWQADKHPSIFNIASVSMQGIVVLSSRSKFINNLV